MPSLSPDSAMSEQVHVYQNLRAPRPHLIPWQDAWSFPGHPRPPHTHPAIALDLCFTPKQLLSFCPRLVSVLLDVLYPPGKPYTCECSPLSYSSFSKGPSRSPQPLLRQCQNKIRYTFKPQESMFSPSSALVCSDSQISSKVFLTCACK